MKMVDDYMFSNFLIENVNKLFNKISLDKSKSILTNLSKDKDLETTVQNQLLRISRGTTIQEFEIFCQRIANSEYKVISTVFVGTKESFLSIISNSVPDVESTDKSLIVSSILLSILASYDEGNIKNKTRELIKECVLFVRGNSKEESKISIVKFIIRKALEVNDEKIIKMTLIGLPLMFS